MRLCNAMQCAYERAHLVNSCQLPLKIWNTKMKLLFLGWIALRNVIRLFIVVMSMRSECMRQPWTACVCVCVCIERFLPLNCTLHSISSTSNVHKMSDMLFVASFLFVVVVCCCCINSCFLFDTILSRESHFCHGSAILCKIVCMTICVVINQVCGSYKQVLTIQ